MARSRAMIICTRIKYTLENVRDAVKETERVENGGAVNPNYPDPRGSVANTLAALREYVDELERATAT
jgi:hypothetical protein